MGLSEGAVVPLSQNFVVKESSPNRMGGNTGVLQAVGSGLFGSILAPLVLVPLALKFGWRSAFFIAEVPGLILAAIVWFYVKKRTTESEANVKDVGMSIKELLQIKNIRYCLGVTCCVLGWGFATLPFIANYFVKIQGMTADEMGKTMGILGVSGLLSGFIVPALTDKFGRKFILLIFLSLGIFYPPAVHFLAGSALHIPLMFITYFAMGCIPIGMALIPASAVPQHSQARAIGLMMGVGEIVGGVLVPAMAGALSDTINPAAFLVVSSVLALLGVLCALGLTEEKIKI